jgi:uncharacterized protein (TIGR02246 family)
MHYRSTLTVVALVLMGGLALYAQQTAPPTIPSPPVGKGANQPAANPQPAGESPIAGPNDEAMIRENASKYVEAYNRRDSRTMAEMWSPDAVYMDPTTNVRIVGRDAIAEHFQSVLAGSEAAKLAIMIDSVDFVSPNVAIEKGSAVVTHANNPAEKTFYSAVHVKRDGQWFIDRVSEEGERAPRPSNYERLRELEWMLGTWIDDAGDGVTVQTDVEWTKNRNFMTRSFAVVIGDQVDMSGMQIIGWDPVKNQIRSWVFDSDGGFGDGTWVRKGNRWIIQSTAILADGGKATATNILTQRDDGTATWQSVNRSVDGELLPNVDEVPLVRKRAD